MVLFYQALQSCDCDDFLLHDQCSPPKVLMSYLRDDGWSFYTPMSWITCWDYPGYRYKYDAVCFSYPGQHGKRFDSWYEMVSVVLYKRFNKSTIVSMFVHLIRFLWDVVRVVSL